MSSSVVKASPVGPDGVVRCQCDQPAAEYTSRTPVNPDRKFYRCTNGQCGFWKWADQIQSTPRNTPSTSRHIAAHNSLKRPNSDNPETQDNPSKRSRSSNAQILPSTPSRTPQQREKRLAVIQEVLAQQKQEPATPSRTPQQRQRCMQDIEAALSQGKRSTASSQASGVFTPSKPDRRAQGSSTQQNVKTEETEHEFDRRLNEEEDPFAPNPAGLTTPPPSFGTSAKGKEKMRTLDHLRDENFEPASSTRLSNNTIPADELVLTGDEYQSLAKEFENRYIAETVKNARLEVKIRSLEKRIKELCRGGSD